MSSQTNRFRIHHPILQGVEFTNKDEVISITERLCEFVVRSGTSNECRIEITRYHNGDEHDNPGWYFYKVIETNLETRIRES